MLTQRSPEPAEIAAAEDVAAFVSGQRWNDVDPRAVAGAAGKRGLLAVHADWWLADSRWWQADPVRERLRHAWSLSPLDDVDACVAWLVPQASLWQLVIPEPERPRSRASAQATSASSAGFASLFGESRGISSAERRRRAAAFLAEQDADAAARLSQVKEAAQRYDRKAQCARYTTMFGEEGFAYELYPPGQKQRRNLDGLVVIPPAGGYQLYVTA